ncbi:MAG TPA: diguanylate cyclase [Rhodocyclaceae bacterium]
MEPSLFDKTRFEQVKAAGNLPSPKEAALKIIRLTQRSDVGVHDLEKAVQLDPAFVGRLIKAANSVKASGHRPIVSIKDALMVMGIPAVRSLALGFSVLSGYRTGRCPTFNYDRFWSQSVVCGVAFQAIARFNRAAPVDEAFSLGLLARIGELALATVYPNEFCSLLNQLDGDDGGRLLQLEREALALTHNELSSAMLIEWGFPRVYVEPVYFHEQPETCGFAEGNRQFLITHSLALAQHIASICLAPPGERKSLIAELQRRGARLSIEADTLNTLCDQVVIDWAEWGRLLKVRYEALPPFEELCKPDAVAEPIVGDAAEIPELPKEGRQMRVMLVEDDRTTRMLLRAIVESGGHEVIEAANGEDGFNRALEFRPHLIVTDWVMPVMSGVEMAKALRNTKPGRDMYIMILTAIDEEERLIEAFDSGVDDYITKPLRPKTIAARLRAGLRVVSLQQDNAHDQEELRRVAAELAISNRRLQELAVTDALTGFPNRRYALERLKQEWSASVRRQTPLSCMVIDVDYFKQVNDSHGHDFGDETLKRIGGVVKGALRAQDVVCRIGGDEFLAICPDTTLDAALACAERIRQQVLALNIRARDLACTISVGVAERDPSMSGPEGLVKRADEGAYLAKEKGRNFVTSAQRQI